MRNTEIHCVNKRRYFIVKHGGRWSSHWGIKELKLLIEKE
jgi:hypothetical protein